MPVIIDGKAVSTEMRTALKEQIAAARDEFWAPIGLAVIIVGENPASKIYVKNKVKAAEDLNIKSFLYELPAEVTQEELLTLIDSLNASGEVNGILVQLPLPMGLDEKAVLNRIDDTKDVDGFSPRQIGKLVLGEPELVACTPKGIMALLDYYGVEIAGKDAVVIGRSNIVGKPVANLLLQRNATVTVCHSKTKDLKKHLIDADIIVAAVGIPKFVKADMIKEGAVVIDVGINRTEQGVVGDVDFEEVAPKCSFITPVPGGVGPMTITMLMENTLAAYKEQNAR